MRRLSLVAFVALWSCHPASTAPGATSASGARDGAIENLFAKHEQSTSFANQTLLSCMSGTLRTGAAAPFRRATKPHVEAWYCACMADAMGVLEKPTVSTDEAAARCVDFAGRTTRKTAPATRTPYSGNSFLNVRQMADALKACRTKLTHEPRAAALGERQQETFCSCLVDSMRYRRTTSTNVPVQETRICAHAAGWSW
jgi:hypothetical protein